jgi:hydroxymethylbilane synthase
VKTLRIATRRSPLALWQARHVAGLLQRSDSSLSVELVELVTTGDRFLQAPLAQVGGKGLFVKEIEAALLDGRAEVAVHSLKDLTSEMPPELCLAAVPEREDPRDAWLSPSGGLLESLAQGARVGTGSTRRTCQLLAARPDLEVVPEKTRELKLSGTMLALAGLKRLGLESRVTQTLSIEQSLPAVGQGALALQCRVDDAHTRMRLVALEHRDSRWAIDAERAFLARLEGGCTVPLAAHATLVGDQLHLRGLIGHPLGHRLVKGERRGPASTRARMGEELAQQLLAEGGAELLAIGKQSN